MAFTLANLLTSALKSLGSLSSSTATGGGTTTVIDTTQTTELTGRTTNDMRYGTIFITRDAGGAGAAPEGEFSIISAFAPSTGTTTVTPAFTQAVAVGDKYSFSSMAYPLDQMIELANDALKDLGPVVCVDSTTLDTDSTHTEYAVAVGWKREILKVMVQNKTTDSNDNQWAEVHGWRYAPAAGGTAGRLIFDMYPYDSHDLQVWYLGDHPTLTVATSVINEHLDPELVVRALVAKALEWKNMRMSGNNPFLVQAWNRAEQRLSERKLTHLPYRPSRKSRLMIVRDSPSYEDEDEFSVP
jgi:hypothetical protein